MPTIDPNPVKNTKERNKAFLRFVLLALLSMGLVGGAVFAVTRAEKEVQKDKAQALVLLDKFEKNSRRISTQLDSILLKFAEIDQNREQLFGLMEKEKKEGDTEYDDVARQIADLENEIKNAFRGLTKDSTGVQADTEDLYKICIQLTSIGTELINEKDSYLKQRKRLEWYENKALELEVKEKNLQKAENKLELEKKKQEMKKQLEREFENRNNADR